MKSKLNIGCGHDTKAGWINHDVVDLPGVDIVHDLNAFPWPWDDESMDEIYMKDVLEHLPNTIVAMEELWRIAKKDARIYIAVPYWNCYEAITDPTHVSFFNEFTFEFFDPRCRRCKNRPYYSTARFHIGKIGYGISPLSPYVPIPRNYIVFYNPVLKKIIQILATYFNNIIIGLEVYLRKI